MLSVHGAYPDPEHHHDTRYASTRLRLPGIDAVARAEVVRLEALPPHEATRGRALRDHGNLGWP